MGPEYPLLSYITILWPMKPEWKIVQIICDHRIVMPVILQCTVNAVETYDIFPYHLCYFGHN